MASGNIQEKVHELTGRVVAYRAYVAHPNKLTKSGAPKKVSKQFAVERQPGDKGGFGMTPAQAKKAAEDWLHDTKQAFREGRDVTTKAGVSVSDAADAWLAAIEVESTKGRGKLRESTLDYYDSLIRCNVHEPPAGVTDIGQLRLSGLTPKIVDEWKKEIIVAKSRSTALRSLMTLKAVLRYSVVEGWIGSNPASDVKLGSEKNADDSITILLQRGHVKAMLKLGRELLEKGYIGEEAPADRLGKSNAWQRKKMMASLYPLLRLGFASGARSGELLAAQAWDFDFERNTFRIERTLTKKGEIGPPKTKRGYRTLAIDTETMGYVKARVEQLGAKKDALVFGSREGKRISGSNLYRSWKRFLAVLDPHLDKEFEPLILPDGSAITSPYHSRHYHASELLQAGVSLGDVSERLGHADTVITQKHYAYLLGDRQAASRAAADRFAAIFSEAAE